jgi:riboflavin kinase/FMN adenylyltransferase
VKLSLTKHKSSVALGYFDGVHSGHVKVLKAALEYQHYKPAVFTFGNRANCNIITEDIKHKLLKSHGIEYIHSFDFQKIKGFSPEEFVEKILIEHYNAKIVSCGYDFKFGKHAKADAGDLERICKAHGIITTIIPPFKINQITVSSSLIRKAIHGGDIETANKFLGYDLFYKLEVVGGNRLGRTIGFPTINQNMPQDLLPPKFGVYKSSVFINSQAYNGITNIGVKPTAGKYKNITIETHIIGYDGDLYGQVIKINLEKFIRPEIKFNNFTELSEQIKKDLKEI